MPPEKRFELKAFSYRIFAQRPLHAYRFLPDKLCSFEALGYVKDCDKVDQMPKARTSYAIFNRVDQHSSPAGKRYWVANRM